MLQNVVLKESKINRQNEQFFPIRVKQKTKQKIDDLLNQVNAKDMGRKVRPDDLILLALDLVKSEHIEKLKEKALTNVDRLEQMFKKFQVSQPTVSKEEFIGLLLDGKLASRQRKALAKIIK